MNTIKIANKYIGAKNKVFVVAELSANHLQKYDLAVETIKMAKAAGADAVKFQTYTPDTVTIDVENKYFQINQGTLWDGKTLYELYKEAYMPWDWQSKLRDIALELDLVWLSSINDKTAVDFLETLDIPAYKLPAFEITDIPLIEYIASKNKPIIFSSGISELSDLEEAISACKRIGNDRVVFLKCTSSYPANLTDMNLLTIPDMRKRFNLVVGLSDHTLSASTAIASVALGAKVVEKHFILDRKSGGPDAKFSIEPNEFKEMVKSIREVEISLGEVSYELSNDVRKNRMFVRSLFVVKDIEKGELINEENIRSIRPGNGLAPKYFKEVMGKKIKQKAIRGTPLTWDLIE